jgi:hypothetical protein
VSDSSTRALASPPTAAEVVARIVAGAIAWTSTAALVGAGIPVALLEELTRAAVLARWDLPTGSAWTLSSYAAACAGVHLVTENGLLRWHGPGTSPPPRVRPLGWNPWAYKTPRIPPRFVIDELYDMEIHLWGHAIPIDPKLGRRCLTPRRTTRRVPVLTPNA